MNGQLELQLAPTDKQPPAANETKTEQPHHEKPRTQLAELPGTTFEDIFK